MPLTPEELEKKILAHEGSITDLSTKTTTNANDIKNVAALAQSAITDVVNNHTKLVARVDVIESTTRPIDALETWFGKAGTYLINTVKNTFPYVLMFAVGIASTQLKGCTIPSPFGPSTPVAPANPLTTTLQGAYNSDGKPAALLAKIVPIYANASIVVNSPNYKQASQVLAAMHTAIEAAAPSPALVNLRKAIATYLDTTLGTKDFDLTDATRANINTQFTNVAKALEG